MNPATVRSSRCIVIVVVGRDAEHQALDDPTSVQAVRLLYSLLLSISLTLTRVVEDRTSELIIFLQK